MEAPDTSTYSKRASKRFRCGAAASPVPPFITSVPPLASFPRGGITVSSGEDALSRRTCFRSLVKVFSYRPPGAQRRSQEVQVTVEEQQGWSFSTVQPLSRADGDRPRLRETQRHQPESVYTRPGKTFQSP
ncbi:hypothetical protein JOQ06_024812 [Pogonophryne albipinna]|uniref:Uncharacterized protein n=1 Tax=Pogonophryne albipinna TaxID=1090488 RepID=A0AAD6FE45_9TELE|nr:hypothetical protein JOQ06_024812 [Pogonophryne albipinna]